MATPRKANPKHGGGPKTTFRAETCAAICEAIAAGATTEEACSAHGVNRTVFLRWRNERPELGDAFARAMEDRGELIGERLRALAATATPENFNVVRLQVDTDKFIASRLAPKRYGDRVGLEHSGKDGGPLKVEIELVGGEE